MPFDAEIVTDESVRQRVFLARIADILRSRGDAVPFNMNHCGVCIGGHLWALMNGQRAMYGGEADIVYKRTVFVREDKVLHDLFWPPAGITFSTITREQAAQAIDNYLACGDPKWREVVNG